MTTTAKLLHLMKKDITQFQLWFLAYLVSVGFSAAIALDRMPATDSSWPAIVAPLTWILGGLISALIVQADAPANPRAYWASVPIESRMLLLSKSVGVFAILFLPPLLAQLLAIRHYSVPAARIVPMMIASGCTYPAWLLLAMLAASVTERFTGFVGMLLGIPALFAILSIVISGSPWRVLTTRVPASTLGVIILVTAASMLLLVYSRRRVGGGLLGAGALVIASGLVAVTAPVGFAVAAPLPPANVRAISMRIAPVDLLRLVQGEEQSLNFNVSGMTPGYQYALLGDSALATWSTPGNTPWTTSVFRGQSPIIFSGKAQSELVGSLFIGVRPTSRDEQQTGAVQSVRVSGEVQTLASRIVAKLPATGHVTVYHGDVQLTVDGIHEIRRGASISFLNGASIFEPSARLAPESRYTLRLVWPGRGDTLQVPLNSTSKVDQLLVLPGARVHKLSIHHVGERSAVYDRLPAPLASAELQLLAWTPIARYPVTMVHNVP